MAYQYRPLLLQGKLRGAAFRVIPDHTPAIMAVTERSSLSAVVLTVQPGVGGLLSCEYLKRQGISAELLHKYIAHHVDEMRGVYVPGLKKEDMVVCMQDLTAVREHNPFKVIIHHRGFPVSLADIVAGRNQA
jgi:hypothetical protein